MEGCDSSLILQGYNVAAGGGVCRSSVARGDCNFSCHVRHGRTQAPQGARGPVSLACFFAGFGAGPRSCAPPSQPIRGQSALPPLSNAYLKLHRNVRREVVRWGEVLRCGGDDDGVIVVVGGGSRGVALTHTLSPSARLGSSCKTKPYRHSLACERATRSERRHQNQALH